MKASDLRSAMETGQQVDYLEGINDWSGPWVIFQIHARHGQPTRVDLIRLEGTGSRLGCTAARIRSHAVALADEAGAR